MSGVDTARAEVLDAVDGLRASIGRSLLLGLADALSTGPERRHPNAVLPCGTDSARRRHLAHGKRCTVCGVPDGTP